jgi:excinuclease UvrABC helicase subunit UvrB
MKKYEKKEELVKFLKLFSSRPNHLAKFLLDNKALNQGFINKLDVNSSIDNPHFKDINQMCIFYKNVSFGTKTPYVEDESLISNMEKELEKLVITEKFEDAVRVRDFIKNYKNK